MRMIRLDVLRRFVGSCVLRHLAGSGVTNDDVRRITDFITVQDGSSAVTTLTVLRDRVTILHLDLKKLLTAILTAVSASGTTSASTLAAGAVAAILVLVDSTRRLDPIFGAIVLCMWARGVTRDAEIIDCVHDRGHTADDGYMNERLQDLASLGVLEKQTDNTYRLADTVNIEYRQPPTLAEWMRRHEE